MYFHGNILLYTRNKAFLYAFLERISKHNVLPGIIKGKVIAD